MGGAQAPEDHRGAMTCATLYCQWSAQNRSSAASRCRIGAVLVELAVVPNESARRRRLGRWLPVRQADALLGVSAASLGRFVDEGRNGDSTFRRSRETVRRGPVAPERLHARGGLYDAIVRPRPTLASDPTSARGGLDALARDATVRGVRSLGAWSRRPSSSPPPR